MIFVLLAQTPNLAAPSAPPPAAVSAAAAAADSRGTGGAAAAGPAATANTTEDTVEATTKASAIELFKSLYKRFVEYLPHLGSAVLVLLLGWWLAGWIKRMLRRLMAARHVDLTLSSFLSNLCYWLIITIVVLVALQNAQFETTPFSAVLGASALAVGLALQGSLSNFAAGVLIILFRHFRVGDFIETGGVMGTVEEISIFHTAMCTIDNRVIIVPNGSILNSPLTNYNAKPTRRLDIVFNISYGSEIKRAKDIILAALNTDARTLKDPAPVVMVSNLGESSVDLLMRAWVKSEDYFNLKVALLEEVKLRFDAAGIDIPFPQHEVHVRQVS
ncbi:MAG TPA: mechanosensitive ion channel domain-containing protein [Opitutales bacterium]|nr:mechanosensitive ion channel domain-containing protein [Opitutales bacterium]